MKKKALTNPGLCYPCPLPLSPAVLYIYSAQDETYLINRVYWAGR